MPDKKRLEDAQVGETIGPYRYRVTREMAEFGSSAEVRASAWFSGDGDSGPGFAPSTLTDNDYSLAFMEKYIPGEVVHTKAENHYLNPPIIGKELTITGRVAERYEKRGRDFLVFETETRDEDGREIVKSRNTVLISL